MKKRWGIWLLVLVVVSGLGGGILFWHKWRQPRETLIGGRTMAAWWDQLGSDDPAEGMSAALALADLAASENQESSACLDLLLDARKALDLRRHRRAVAGLIRLGPAAAPALVKALSVGGPRVETALVRMGPAAVPALEKALQFRDSAPHAARVLGGIGPRARPAVGALVGLLQDLDAKEEARSAAATALGRIGPEKDAPVQAGEDAVIDALTAVLSEKGKVRVQAARALSVIGLPARSAVPSLARLARERDIEVAAVACEALGQIGGIAAVEPLTMRLLAADGASKSAALALARLGPAARLSAGALISALKSDKEDGLLAGTVLERLGIAVVPDLEAALKDKAPGIRRGAADVLGLMGPRAGAAVPALVELLADADAGVALSAAQALVRIEPAKVGLAVPVLVRLLQVKDEKTAALARMALISLGPDARSAVPVLLKALAGKDEQVVYRAAEVLGYIGLATEEVVTALRSTLAGPASAPMAAAMALGRLGSAAASAIPDLMAAAKVPSQRLYCALAILRIAPERSGEAGRLLAESLAGKERDIVLLALRDVPQVPAEVLPALRPLLADRQTASQALRVVRGFAPMTAKEVVSDLITLLSGRDPHLRLEVGWVLRRIGKPALPGLKRALSSPSLTTRAAAAWTLGWPPLHEPHIDPAFLLPLLEDSDESVRLAAADACAALGARSEKSIEAMLKLLGGAEADIRSLAVTALRPACRTQPGQLTAWMIECLLDPSDAVRLEAAGALSGAGRSLPTDAVAALKDALHDHSEAVRLAAASTLAVNHAAGEKELVDVLLPLARAADPGGRRQVLRILFGLSVARARELAGLVEADMRAEEVEDRTAAAEWLIRLDNSSAEKVLPFLVAILEGWDSKARFEAVATLGRLGPLARPAVPALKRRVAIDALDAVRTQARQALKQIESAAP